MRHLLSLFSLLLTLFMLSLPATAAGRAIVILDASGSMWAQVDGKTRIEIARDTLGQVLSGVPEQLELGFMAYGHRAKGDCADIELMVPPEAGTADRIVSAAMSLNPRGKTPLSDAVRMAAEDLKYTEDEATVVLITDGIETCNADPCALASELEAAGVGFTVNVVGFGLSEEEGTAVKCLADNTGGTYISADDEAGLKDAIDVAVNDLPPPEPQPEEPQPVEPPSDVTFNPSVFLAEGDDPLGENENSVTWEFSKPNADGTPGEWVETHYGNAVKAEVAPGEYVLSARIDKVSVDQPITIEAGKVAKPQVVLNAGRLVIRPIPYEGGDPDDDAAVYLEFPNGESTTYYGEAKLFVPAGTTRVSVTIGAANVVEEIEVAAGDTVVRDIVVGVGHATVNAAYVEGMRVEDGGIFTEILGAKKAIDGSRESFGYAYGPDATFELLPGDYVAVSSLSLTKAEHPFTVVAGEAVVVEVPLNAGVLFVDAPGAYSIAIQGKKDIQGKRADIGFDYGVTVNHTLAAGDYHVLVSYEGDTAPKETDVKVIAGERTETKVE